MLKLLFGAALVASPVPVIRVPVPHIIVAIDGVMVSKEDSHIAVVHKSDTTIGVLIGGCSSPRAGESFYVFAIPEVGMFMSERHATETAILDAHGDFAKAATALINGHAMCTIVKSKTALKT